VLLTAKHEILYARIITLLFLLTDIRIHLGGLSSFASSAIKDQKFAMSSIISVIDDDEAVREATGDLIQSLGYATATFASAAEYLHSGRVSDTACVIADVQMPGMSGTELQQRLIADGHTVPVIFMTAFPEERMRVRLLSAGAFGYLRKPFSDNCLITCLDKALAG
jgi:FixJ family two-component response regulator